MKVRILPAFVCGIVSTFLFAACGGPKTPVATRINPKDGAVYVYVPAGPFSMGSSDEVPGFDAEKPQMPNFGVDGFWIMQTEVTTAQYAKCVEAGACTVPFDPLWNDKPWNDPAYAEHSVVGVDWYQANAYAQWTGGRLPSEAEWEKACRGTDGRIFPWGDEPATQARATFGFGGAGSMPVGSCPSRASPYGALDMAGNVSEFTATKWVENYQNYQPDNEPKGDAVRTVRGGGLRVDVSDERCAFRVGIDPGDNYMAIGFRVLSPSP